MKRIHSVLRRSVPLIIASLALSLASPAFAVEYGGIGGRPANPQPNNPRTDSIFVFTIKPGETLHDAVRVINNSNDTKTLAVYAADSEVSSGGAFACKQLSEPKTDVGSWITLEKNQVTLASMTNEVVPFTITAPKNADVGEHNGCILIQEANKAPVPGGTTGSNGVMLSFRTGLRVAVLVPGDIVRKLEITGFDAHPKADGKEVLVASVKNSGNVSVDSDVQATVTWLGQKVASDGGQYPVLRGETSQLNFEIPKQTWGGWYTAHLAVEYDAAAGASIGVKSGQPPTRIEGPSVTYFSWPTKKGGLIEVGVLLAIIIALCSMSMSRMRMRKLRASWTDYTVVEGDDLNTLATARGADWKLIAKVNNLKPPYSVKPGQHLKLPAMK